MEPNQNQQPQYQPPSEQPAFPQPQPQQPVPPAYPQSQENPGQTFGILSIVMIFVFPLLGIVFGALSRSKSKAAGMPSGLGTAGLIINIILTVLGILFSILFFVLVIAGAAQSADTSSSSSSSSSLNSGAGSSLADDAEAVEKRAELYNAETGDYPKSVSDFSKLESTTLPDDLYVNGSIYTNSAVTYVYCGEGAAQIVYLGSSEADKNIVALGSASSTEACPRKF